VKKFNVGYGYRNWIWILTLSLTVLAIPPWAGADGQNQEAAHILDEVVVTSTSKTTMLDTPASISVVTAADLEQIGAKNIIEALERIPGVYNTSSSRTSLSIRGTRSSMAGGPVILVDGVAQKYGSYRREELDIIPVSQIERIEVLRSAGVVYGPGSSRGVINIITKKGQTKKPVAVGLSGSYGSWGTHNLSGSLSGRAAQWDYYGDFAHFTTDGYEDEEETRTAGLLKLGYNLSAETRLGLRGSWLDSERKSAYGLYKYDWHLDNHRRELHFPQSETDDDVVWHNFKEQDSALYALDFSHKGPRLFMDGTVSYTDYGEVYHDTKDIYYSTSDARGDEDDRDQGTCTAAISTGYHFDFGAIDYTPSVGLSYEEVDFKQRRTYPYDTGTPRSTDRYDLDLGETSYGLFWDNDLAFGDHWGLKIGNRIDQVDLEFENRQPVKFDTDETMWSWALAPSYHITAKANVYLSVSRNFWTPSPQYYFWANNYDENDPEELKPEQTTTYEVGYKHQADRSLNLALTAYFAKTEDKFSGHYNSDGDYQGQKNTGDAETYGLEAEVDGRPLEWLGYRLMAAYIQAQWKSGQARINAHPSNAEEIIDLDGRQVHGIPEWTGRLGLDLFPIKGLKASLDANYWGEYDLDYGNRVAYPDKMTLDASISYAWSKYKIWILGKNLFDEEIERALNADGELTGPGGEPENSYYVQDGIYLEAGLSINF
jgi:iron complex outermembrane receptor protein